MSNFCDMGQCGSGDPEGCMNMMTDPGETDVDCGGDCVEDPNDPNNDNGKCLPGEACLIASDCVTDLCVDGVCEEDPCNDDMQNNDETDVDCGQSCVEDPNDPLDPEGKCDNGEACLINSDCKSNVCDPDNNICLDVCMNMMQDEAETDVDCGGGNCVEVNPDNMNDIEGQCGPGEACLDDVDCVAGNCVDDACDVCAPVDGYSDCALCLVGSCCDKVTACLLGIPKCVCWFNCISEPLATVQECMDECGNGNIGMIQSCISNTCNNECI